MTYRKKLIEVSHPLEAINVASVREKSIRHGLDFAAVSVNYEWRELVSK